MTSKSRFAPSPTGYLHIGGARTALFAYLYAKSQNGKFVLRIEDTDQTRSTKEATQAILEGMQWLGLIPDEGPYYQSQRFQRYQQVAEQLLAEGKAYRCYCSKERLEQLREQQMSAKQKPRYDGCCRHLSEELSQPYVIRFKNPLSGEVSWQDQVHGKIIFKNNELDDLVLLRSDGIPTYNFSVVIDDWDMGITEVIRGDDHINNTPRQLNLYYALGVEPPSYAHVPMILGEEGKKLSKRDGAANLLEYRDEGFLPEALLNYLVRLGWSHGDQEVFSMQEMVQCFDTAHISKSAAKLNREKLLWLNQHYMKTLPAAIVAEALQPHFARMGVDVAAGPAVETLVKVQAERCKTLVEMAEASIYFYQDFACYDEKAAQKFLSAEFKPVCETLMAEFKLLPIWLPENIHQIIVDVAEAKRLKLGKVAQPMRVAVTGSTISPSIDVTLWLLGRERTLQRLQQALEYIDSPLTK